MKLKIALISLLSIIIIIILIILLVNKNDKKEITNIKSFSFSYSNGYGMYSNVRYNIEKKDNTYIARVKPNEIPDEEKVSVIVDDSFVDKLIKILNKYDVSSWDGFQKSDPDVLDGDSFSISIIDNEGNSISASGYMMYPNNYREVENELDNIFMKLYNSKTGGNL